MNAGLLAMTKHFRGAFPFNFIFPFSFLFWRTSIMNMIHELLALLPQLPTLRDIIVWGGYAGLFAIIFSETGLFVGFFLPGDSLLVTAGLFASQGYLNIFLLDLLLCIAAVAGDGTGFWIGLKAGHKLYNRPQSKFFRRDHLIKTKQFYDKYGGVTIIIAHFIPFARTFAPVVAKDC